MCNIRSLRVVVIGSLYLLSASGQTHSAKVLSTNSGVAAFESRTNVPGVEVSGKSAAVSARVEVFQEGNRMVLRSITASVPVNTLSTGMKLRDEHMRKYIFRTAEGQEPDLRFDAEQCTCESNGKRDFLCQVSGRLSIRGNAQPFTLKLNVKDESATGERFYVSGDGLVKLSTFSIPTPSQFGVKPSDEVKIKLDFTAKATGETTTAAVSR